uniref:26S proteasome complex subunit SEM1 n=1 Tax=Vespula pensylvanica TaxID=30213 RepID=A0A834K4Q5_VESPE|nr:hypothetical protein H0235_015572 [Vespula pensylvanica]
MYNCNVIRITCTIFDIVEIELSIFFKMTDGKNDKVKVDLGLLEEDDEFEEFPAEDWTAKDEDNEDISVWEDNWDDDDVEDDFNQQLRYISSNRYFKYCNFRAQLEKQKGQGEPTKED